MRDSTHDVFVMRGIVNRFVIASARKALRIVEPSVFGTGVILGFAAGDLEFDILAMEQLSLVCSMGQIPSTVGECSHGI